MSVEIKLTDGVGNECKVTPEGALNVVVHPHPPVEDSQRSLPFRQFFTLNGDGVTNDMRVDGSTTQQQFRINALPDQELYIANMSFLLSDASMTLNAFGALTALTNGCSFEWDSIEIGTTTIADELKTNFDIIRFCGGQPAFAEGNKAFIASNISGTSEGIIPIVNFSQLFGFPYGLRLKKATKDSLVFNINDNLSVGIDAFNVIAYGFKI